MFKCENEMRPIVTHWFEKNGYYVAHEVQIGSSWCDIVGCKWAERVGRRIPPMTEAVAVELKLDRVADVLYQANMNYKYGGVTSSYAAMPVSRIARMRERTIGKFSRAGCGLIMASPYRVEIVVRPRYRESEKIDKNLARRLWSYRLRENRARRRDYLK
jgi:hypothetical protein